MSEKLCERCGTQAKAQILSGRNNRLDKLHIVCESCYAWLITNFGDDRGKVEEFFVSKARMKR